MNNRIFYYNGSSLVDFSVALNEYPVKTKVFNYEVGQFLYIGARLPFNHIYFKIPSLNTVSCTMKVEHWDGNVWKEMAEVIDETEGFTKSGHVQFTPDPDEDWEMESTNDNGELITGLTTIKVYNRYWLRISFDENFQGALVPESDPAEYEDVELQWVGNLFSNDNDLAAEFPDLVRTKVLTSYQSGKTTWEEQHVRASDILIQDLINKGIMDEKGQILDWREFTNTSIQKVAEIIFNAFGDDYTDQLISARKEYNERLSKRLNRIDLNKNAIEDVQESYNPSGFMSR